MDGWGDYQRETFAFPSYFASTQRCSRGFEAHLVALVFHLTEDSGHIS